VSAETRAIDPRDETYHAIDFIEGDGAAPVTRRLPLDLRLLALHFFFRHPSASAPLLALDTSTRYFE
jgi:hypothetical protein